MMSLKGFGRKLSWHNFKALSLHSPGGTEENYKKLTQDSRDLNPGPPEYETGMLTTLPRRSMAGCCERGNLTFRFHKRC
jgi:hypothetical protein